MTTYRFQCLSRQTIKWNQAQAPARASTSRPVSMPQSANDQVEPEGNRVHNPPTSAVSMPQSANDQVELQMASSCCSDGSLFQCLSRQTIKWNPVPVAVVMSYSQVSMPQSANDQVELTAIRQALRARQVSMPQSANDQVELWPFSILYRILVPFQCLSRQTIKWNVRPKPGRVSLLGGFNASVGKRSSGTARSSGIRWHRKLFQCLSRQTIKWNLKSPG